MPVNKEVLEENILLLINQQDPRWLGFPETTEEAAVNWSNALAAYLRDLTSPAAPAAEDGLVNGIPAFREAFVNTPDSSDLTKLDAGLIAMVDAIRVVSLAQGLSTMPTAAPPFKTYADQNGPSGDVARVAELLALQVDLWLKTATFGATGEPWL